MKQVLIRIAAVLFIMACIAGSVYVLLYHRDDRTTEYRETIGQADAYMEQGYYVEALACMKQAEAMQENTAVEEKMAEAYFEMGDNRQFLRMAENVQSLTGGSERMYVLMGKYYMEQNQKKSAIDIVREGHEKFPDNQELQGMYDAMKGSYTKVYKAYSNVSALYDGMMYVQEEKGEILLDASKSKLTNQVYDAIYDISTEDTNRKIWNEDSYIISACLDGVHGYYDSNGYLRRGPEQSYAYLGCFHNGLALVQKETTWGYIDASFTEIRMKYEAASAYAGGVAAVRQNGKWGLVDVDGNPLTEFVYDDVVMDSYKRCSVGGIVFFKKGDSYCMVDSTGRTIAEGYEEAKPFYEKGGYAAIKKDGVWCAVDCDGQEYLAGEYEELDSSSQGILAYKKDGLWGYTSVDDGIYTEAEFAEVCAVNEMGYAAVRENNEGDTSINTGQGSGWMFIRFDRFDKQESIF